MLHVYACFPGGYYLIHGRVNNRKYNLENLGCFAKDYDDGIRNEMKVEELHIKYFSRALHNSEC